MYHAGSPFFLGGHHASARSCTLFPVRVYGDNSSNGFTCQVTSPVNFVKLPTIWRGMAGQIARCPDAPIDLEEGVRNP
jgi:hypothetical protein